MKPQDMDRNTRVKTTYSLHAMVSHLEKITSRAAVAAHTAQCGEHSDGEFDTVMLEVANFLSGAVLRWQEIPNHPKLYALEKYERAMKAVELRRNWTQEAPMYGQDIEGS